MIQTDNERNTTDRLARIETKLDAFIDIQEDHSKVLDAIKTRMNWGHGVGATILFILAFFGDAVRSIFTR